MIYVPDMFTDEQWDVIGVAFLLVCLWAVAFLTWAVVSGTLRVTNWFLKPRARSADELAAADDTGGDTRRLALTATVGLMLGFGIVVALFDALR